jgi:hypothetical protein
MPTRLPQPAGVRDKHAMDAGSHYRHLLTLSRDEFLAAAAPAVLVRRRMLGAETFVSWSAAAIAIDPETLDVTRTHGKFSEETTEMEIYPLAKKPGASFPDRITIGRITNNDVVISQHSVSRLHAYVRHVNGWVIADAGSKNGSWLDDQLLEPRREAPLLSGAVLRLGDVRLTFYPSADLFDLHGAGHGRR